MYNHKKSYLSKQLFIISYSVTGNHYGYHEHRRSIVFLFIRKQNDACSLFVIDDRINLNIIFQTAKDMIFQLVCIDIITYVCHIITRSGSLILGVDLKTIWTVSVGDHCIFMHLFSFLLSNITFKYTLQSKGYQYFATKYVCLFITLQVCQF